MIALKVFLLLSYLPLYNVSVDTFQNGLSTVNFYNPQEIIFAQELGGEVSFLKITKVFGSVKTLTIPGPQVGYFSPFEANYKIGAAVFLDHIEIGVLHECDHPVIAAPFTRKVQLQREFTEVYLKLSADFVLKE